MKTNIETGTNPNINTTPFSPRHSGTGLKVVVVILSLTALYLSYRAAK